MFRSFEPSDSSPPSLSLLFAETRVLSDWARGMRENPQIAAAHNGNGQPVMVLPGFMVDDARMGLMKATLRRAGYRAHGWGLGRNLGITPDMLDRLDARMDRIERESGRPAALLGWSLGGLIAREYAKRAPHRVSSVITMGSPFSGSIRANHAWRLYEWVAKHPVDAPPIESRLAEKPPVPTYALWSRRDGVVAPASARGVHGERDEAIEVDCTHLAFACAPEAMRAVLGVLGRQGANAETGMAFAA
jgi:pimeloyl-ACP methyl ester carboxylesterase